MGWNEWVPNAQTTHLRSPARCSGSSSDCDPANLSERSWVAKNKTTKTATKVPILAFYHGNIWTCQEISGNSHAVLCRISGWYMMIFLLNFQMAQPAFDFSLLTTATRLHKRRATQSHGQKNPLFMRVCSISQMRTMVLEYWPTWLGHFYGFYVPSGKQT